ncbi:MAG: Fur family transcriptional regulator [Candidatus Nanopelagicales bacterium]
MSAAGKLREAGLRATKQRIHVLEIVDQERHVTVDQVVEECAGRGTPIDLSTAYRTLVALDDAGLITHAHLNSGSPTYHRIDPNPHIHLVCRECDAVDSIPAAQLAQVVDQIRVACGFVVDTGHLVMHGNCATCALQKPTEQQRGKAMASEAVAQG